MGLFSKEHVVCEVLNDSGDNHKPFPHSGFVFLRYFDVDRLRRYDRRGNEPEEHESPESRELRIWPDFVPTRD